jgi:Mce-associated membrane protein
MPNLVLAVVVLLLLLAAAVLLGRGDSEAADQDAGARTLSRQYAEVTRAARAETTAFLSVDYRHPDPLTRRVLDGATGAFATEYRRELPDLLASTRRSRSVATGRVRSVGVGRVRVGRVGDDRAVVLVAADSRVTNRRTHGKPQSRFYRLQLTLVHRGDRWLTSSLRFVG